MQLSSALNQLPVAFFDSPMITFIVIINPACLVGTTLLVAHGIALHHTSKFALHVKDLIHFLVIPALQFVHLYECRMSDSELRNVSDHLSSRAKSNIFRIVNTFAHHPRVSPTHRYCRSRSALHIHLRGLLTI